MRVLVVAPGSTGDVAPYTGLGVRLRADGHDVAIAANERFRAMVTGAGLVFRLLRGDAEAGTTTEAGRRRHASGSGPMAAEDGAGAVAATLPSLVPGAGR